MRRTVTIVAALLVMAAACTNGDDDDELANLVDDSDPPADATDDPDPEPEPDPEPDPEPEPDEVAEFAVPDDPDDIDVDYIEAVLDRMHAGLVPAARDAVTTGEITDDLEAAVADVYIEDDVALELEGWEIRMSGELNGAEVPQLVPDLEGRTHRLVQPVLLSTDCLIAIVDVDTAPLYGDDDPLDLSHAIVLVGAEPAPPVNPTPWRFAADAVWQEGGVPDWAYEACD